MPLWLSQKQIWQQIKILLFTDTDSLLYEIETWNVYDDFSNNKDIFDFNNYSAESKYEMIQTH